MQLTAETLLGLHYKLAFITRWNTFASLIKMENLLCIELENYLSKIMQYLFMESIKQDNLLITQTDVTVFSPEISLILPPSYD